MGEGLAQPRQGRSWPRGSGRATRLSPWHACHSPGAGVAATTVRAGESASECVVTRLAACEIGARHAQRRHRIRGRRDGHALPTPLIGWEYLATPTMHRYPQHAARYPHVLHHMSQGRWCEIAWSQARACGATPLWPVGKACCKWIGVCGPKHEPTLAGPAGCPSPNRDDRRMAVVTSGILMQVTA